MITNTDNDSDISCTDDDNFDYIENLMPIKDELNSFDEEESTLMLNKFCVYYKSGYYNLLTGQLIDTSDIEEGEIINDEDDSLDSYKTEVIDSSECEEDFLDQEERCLKREKTKDKKNVEADKVNKEHIDMILYDDIMSEESSDENEKVLRINKNDTSKDRILNKPMEICDFQFPIRKIELSNTASTPVPSISLTKQTKKKKGSQEILKNRPKQFLSPINQQCQRAKSRSKSRSRSRSRSRSNSKSRSESESKIHPKSKKKRKNEHKHKSKTIQKVLKERLLRFRSASTGAQIGLDTEAHANKNENNANNKINNSSSNVVPPKTTTTCTITHHAAVNTTITSQTLPSINQNDPRARSIKYQQRLHLTIDPNINQRNTLAASLSPSALPIPTPLPTPTTMLTATAIAITESTVPTASASILPAVSIVPQTSSSATPLIQQTTTSMISPTTSTSQASPTATPSIVSPTTKTPLATVINPLPLFLPPAAVGEIHHSIQSITRSYDDFLSYIFIWNLFWLGRSELNKDPVRYFDEKKFVLRKDFGSYERYKECFLPFLMSEVFFAANNQYMKKFKEVPEIELMINKVSYEINATLNCHISKKNYPNRKMDKGQLITLNVIVDASGLKVPKTYFGIINQYKLIVKEGQLYHSFKIITKRSAQSNIIANGIAKIQIIANINDYLGQIRSIFSLNKSLLIKNVVAGVESFENNNVQDNQTNNQENKIVDPRLKKKPELQKEIDKQICLTSQMNPSIKCLLGMTKESRKNKMFYLIGEYLKNNQKQIQDNKYDKILIVPYSNESSGKWTNFILKYVAADFVAEIGTSSYKGLVVKQVKEIVQEKLIATQQTLLKVYNAVSKKEIRLIGKPAVQLEQEIDFYQKLIDWTDNRVHFTEFGKSKPHFQVLKEELVEEASIKCLQNAKIIIATYEKVDACFLIDQLFGLNVNQSINDLSFDLLVVEDAHFYNESQLVSLFRFKVKTALLEGNVNVENKLNCHYNNAVDRGFNLSLMHRLCN